MVYVVWYNSHGCELMREKFSLMETAAQKVSDMCQTGALEPGDTIKFEEVE